MIIIMHYKQLKTYLKKDNDYYDYQLKVKVN